MRFGARCFCSHSPLPFLSLAKIDFLLCVKAKNDFEVAVCGLWRHNFKQKTCHFFSFFFAHTHTNDFACQALSHTHLSRHFVCLLSFVFQTNIKMASGHRQSCTSKGRWAALVAVTIALVFAAPRSTLATTSTCHHGTQVSSSECVCSDTCFGSLCSQSTASFNISACSDCSCGACS